MNLAIKETLAWGLQVCPREVPGIISALLEAGILEEKTEGKELKP